MTEAIGWFKGQFRTAIQASIQDTPFSVDLLTAIAMQETYYIWGDFYQRLPVAEVLKLCVGDTLDTPNRIAFPKNKSELLQEPKGDQMFALAREALESLGPYSSRYHEVATFNPNKFCHGFGIFQYDIQFFKTNPDYFLEKRWCDFDACLAVCVQELKAALRRTYSSGKITLTDEEMVYVAIAYNRGSVNFPRGFKQGYRDESGKYYGEHIWEYLQLAKSVP
ncbi:MAG: peptide-binding protein [Cyanobacteria bacterium 13_1_40CM_2_61_4]|nr:MAG: peptide-binding protein [Cyanobacteria bacterium 13_1_40CM_2_61_4]